MGHVAISLLVWVLMIAALAAAIVGIAAAWGRLSFQELPTWYAGDEPRAVKRSDELENPLDDPEWSDGEKGDRHR